MRPAWSPNGQRIVFNRYAPGADIVVMNADGTGQTSLGPGYDPSWSPDGSKLVFVAIGECGDQSGGIHTMNPDGTGRAFLGCGPPGVGEDGEGTPVWSPDGGLVAFSADLAEFDIFTIEPSGANRINLTTSPTDLDRDPNWSPDASRIAWGRDPFSVEAVWVMNRDGTGKAQLIPGASDPAWSPDGSKIVTEGITVHAADGTSATFLTSGVDPDWQPIPVNSYPRPKGATPTRAALVPAYRACVSPNRIHGPPLGFDSCSSPQMASDHLTVGTGDSNGKPARSAAHVWLVAIVGNPTTPADEADAAMGFVMNDVYTKAMVDYDGELRVRITLQVTDKDNTPNPGGPGAGTGSAATTTEIPLEMVASCSPTINLPDEGAYCSVSTSADTLAPGSVKEGRRAVWQVNTVGVYDGGADGDASTPSGDTLFATQGLFVP